MNVMKNLRVILTEKGREKIKEMRKNRFGSQMNASDEIGISQINISKWERGVSSPRFYSLISYLTKI